MKRESLPLLLRVLNSGRDVAVQKEALAKLENLRAMGPDGGKACIAAGATPPLLHVLGSPGSVVQHRAATSLANIVLASPTHAEALAMAGGLPPLVQLLASADRKAQEAAARAVAHLARFTWQLVRLEESHARVEARDIPPLVLQLGSSRLLVQEAAAAVLANLSAGSPALQAAAACWWH